jgi:hypothetical protein
MRLKRALASTAILLGSSTLCLSSYADDQNDNGSAYKIRGIASIGLTFGGDTFTKVKFDNGDNDNIKAGELAIFSAGAIYEQENWQVQGTIGYYSDRASGDNGDVCFTRIPLEVLGFWKKDNFRLGAGITHHLNPEFEVDIDGSIANGTIDFDDATGFVIQGDYFFANQFGLGLRFTSVEYEADFLEKKIDGDSVGFLVSYAF